MINTENTLWVEKYRPVELKDYIGNDYCMFNTSFFKTNIKGLSGNWHTDNLGNKLNLLFVLSDNAKIPTIFLKRSHKKKYKPNFFEELRIYKKNVRHYKDEVELLANKGDLLLIDGNGLHRGKYENHNISDERLVLFSGFINRNKIYELGYKQMPKFLGLNLNKLPFNIFIDNKITPIYK